MGLEVIVDHLLDSIVFYVQWYVYVGRREYLYIGSVLLEFGRKKKVTSFEGVLRSDVTRKHQQGVICKYGNGSRGLKIDLQVQQGPLDWLGNFLGWVTYPP